MRARQLVLGLVLKIWLMGCSMGLIAALLILSVLRLVLCSLGLLLLILVLMLLVGM